MQNKVAQQHVARLNGAPAHGAPVQISAQDLVTDYLLPNGLSSIIIVDIDGHIRGVARLDRIVAQPRERWAHVPVGLGNASAVSRRGVDA